MLYHETSCDLGGKNSKENLLQKLIEFHFQKRHSKQFGEQLNLKIREIENKIR